MKRYEPDLTYNKDHGEAPMMSPDKDGCAVLYWDLFPTAPDGKRHPTQREILDFTQHGTMARVEAVDAVFELLTRLHTVAPKEE